MKFFVAAVLAAVSCASVAHGQTVPDASDTAAWRTPVRPGAPLTLERAIALAEGASPSGDVAQAEKGVADAERAVAGLRPNPSVTIEAENVLGSGAYSGVESIETTGTLSVPIELGGKRASPIEAQRADVARINADAEVERAARLEEVERLRLARRVGQPIEGPLDDIWFGRIPPRVGPLPRVSAAGTLALAAAEADLATADARVRLARAQRIPDLTLGAGARRLDNGDAAFLFSLSVPLPLFDTGRAGIDQAKAERVRAEAQGRLTRLEAEEAIAQAQADVANAATSAIAANGPALAAAEETARIARIGYREGKFGQLDLLDAERTLADTRAAAIDALAAHHIAQARLRRLTTPMPIAGDIR